jgi:hypothetical protein
MDYKLINNKVINKDTGEEFIIIGSGFNYLINKEFLLLKPTIKGDFNDFIVYSEDLLDFYDIEDQSKSIELLKKQVVELSKQVNELSTQLIKLADNNLNEIRGNQ